MIRENSTTKKGVYNDGHESNVRFNVTHAIRR